MKIYPEFLGWKLSYSKNGKCIECRKTFKKDGKPYGVYGQALMIIGKDSCNYKNETLEADVRLSMNGPCGMTMQEFEEMHEVMTYVKAELDE